MGEALPRVQGGGPVAGIFAMVPYSETLSAESKRAFATSIIVSEEAQKNFGGFIHIIGKTSSIQIMTTSSSGAYGTTYVKAFTWDGRKVPRWYTSVTSSFDMRRGALYVSASHIAWKVRGEVSPNCIKSETTFLLVVPLTLRVPSSSFDDRLRMRPSWQCSWWTTAMWDS